MKDHDEFDSLVQSLKNIKIPWNEQRKRAIHHQVMNSIQHIDRRKKHQKTVWRFSFSMILFLSICIGGYFIIIQPDATHSPQPSPHPQTPSGHADLSEIEESFKSEKYIVEEITLLVEAFGEQLEFVSLLAPDQAIQESIETHYEPYISQELLSTWLDDPSTAPGRLVSSPWPDRIEILDIEKIDDHEYHIQGEVIEITSTEQETEDAANTYPIYLTVRQIEDEWLIDDVRSENMNDDAVFYENTTYGFTMALPDTWNEYDVIEDDWEGMLLDGSNDRKSGPKILIRHPEWREDVPRQDIPILVLTHQQWQAIQNEALAIGAAPIPPRELGQNEQYVFALEARYNMEFLPGYEEVEEILESESFEATDRIENES